MPGNEKELKGLEEVVELLIEKLTALRKESVIASDPSLRFQIKKQIEELEKGLSDTKANIEKLRSSSKSRKISKSRSKISGQCQGKTKKGVRCKRKTRNKSGFCYLHN